MNDQAPRNPRGVVHHLDAHGATATPLTSRGLSDLAAQAMARVIHASRVGELSDEAKACCKQSPMATALATALCDDTNDTADLMVEDLIDAGLSVEDVCLDHLAPAARCLGEWWETDRLPFTEVAMATSRIQSMLRRMPSGRMAPRSTLRNGAVFAAVPGEQHTLGVMMAADLFRRAGWDVGLLVGQSHDEIITRLARDDRQVIGLSCSGDHSFAALKRLMLALRKNRPNAHVLVSGRIVACAERLADLPVPFTVVEDAASAERQMQRLEEDIAAEAAVSKGARG